MTMGTADNGFAITKPKPTQNLNYQTHPARPQPAVGFNFLKKTHPLWVLTITKLTMVPSGFFRVSIFKITNVQYVNL